MALVHGGFVDGSGWQGVCGTVGVQGVLGWAGDGDDKSATFGGRGAGSLAL